MIGNPPRQTRKIKSITDQGDGYLVEVELSPDATYAETWTYEAMGTYLNGLAERGLLEVEELAPMEGA